MFGTQIITDPQHSFTKHRVFPAEMMASAATLIESEETFSDFLGFGAAITGSSCWNLNLMDPQERTTLLRQLYTEDGLNMAVARLTVGSSDYSAEVYSYDDVPGDTALEHFSIRRDREYIIPMIREILRSCRWSHFSASLSQVPSETFFGAITRTCLTSM